MWVIGDGPKIRHQHTTGHSRQTTLLHMLHVRSAIRYADAIPPGDPFERRPQRCRWRQRLHHPSRLRRDGPASRLRLRAELFAATTAGDAKQIAVSAKAAADAVFNSIAAGQASEDTIINFVSDVVIVQAASVIRPIRPPRSSPRLTASRRSNLTPCWTSQLRCMLHTHDTRSATPHVAPSSPQ